MKKKLTTIVIGIVVFACVFLIGFAGFKNLEDQRIVEKHYITTEFDQTVCVYTTSDGFGNVIDVEMQVLD